VHADGRRTVPWQDAAARTGCTTPAAAYGASGRPTRRRSPDRRRARRRFDAEVVEARFLDGTIEADDTEKNSCQLSADQLLFSDATYAFAFGVPSRAQLANDVGLERGVTFPRRRFESAVLVAGEEEPADDRQARVLRAWTKSTRSVVAAAGAAEGQNRRIPQLVAFLGLDDAEKG
jgi:hypothetical protein